MKSDLGFQYFFEKALKDWPEEVVFEKVIYYSEERYSIEGLYDFSDALGNSYIGHPEEMIMGNLHDSLYIVLHKLGEYTTRVFLKDIRPEIVQRKLEVRLKSALDDPELGWSAEAIQLIKDYFSVNGKDQDN